jgi:TPR repeat protein
MLNFYKLNFKNIVFYCTLLVFAVLTGCDLLSTPPPTREAPTIHVLRKAEKGDMESQFSLGEYFIHYKDGNENKEDFDEAINWLQKAAEQGHSNSQFLLARCFFNGDGFISDDKEEAVQWFRKAADQDNRAAQYYLGCCYYNGDGVEKDTHEAFKWFHKAAEQGHLPAQHRLAECYYNGVGTAKNRAEGLKWRKIVSDRVVKEY